MTGPSDERQVAISSGGLEATIALRGAQLTSLSHDGTSLLWPGSPTSWPGQAPILFPVIGPLDGGLFKHEGREYPMPAHGFAQSSDFSLTRSSPSGCTLELCDSEATRSQYPFGFRLEAEFSVEGGFLRCTLQAHNTGPTLMPADMGFHPGFDWPLVSGRAKADHQIRFDRPEPDPIRRGTGDPIMLLPEARPTPVEGDTLHLRDELFVDLPIVFDQIRSHSLTFGVPGEPGLSIAFPDSPYLALWMLPGEKFLAIEPWYGLPSPVGFSGPFIEKPGVAVVPPEGSLSQRLIVTPTDVPA